MGGVSTMVSREQLTSAAGLGELLSLLLLAACPKFRAAFTGGMGMIEGAISGLRKATDCSCWTMDGPWTDP